MQGLKQPEVSYTCKNCGHSYPRWEAVTTKHDEYQLHKNSLIYHFILNPECNKANAEVRKQNRIERDNQAYHEMMEMI